MSRRVLMLFLVVVFSSLSAVQANQTKRVELVTYDKLLEYLELGVREEKLLKLIEESPTVFTLGKDQAEELRKAGAAESVIEALQKRNSLANSSDISAFVIILDCSGSMLDESEKGTTKWQAAQKASLDLVAAIPAGRELAFIVYGHDVARKCEAVDAIRTLSPLNEAGRVALIKRIRALSPQGHTPIALALRTAGKELARTDRLSKVILITDGIETCHGDPNKEARILANGKKVQGVDVIGLGLNDDESKAVSQIAKAGKGTYYNARSVKQLQASVRTIEQEVAKPVAKPAGKPTLKTRFVLKGHTKEVNAVAFSPKGDLLVTGSADKTIRVWNMKTGDRKDRIEHDSETRCLAFSPDGKILASGCENKSVALWDVASGEKLRTLEDVSSDAVRVIRWSPDGKRLATVGYADNKPVIWDLKSGKALVTLTGHKYAVTSFAFSPNGEQVATGACDSTIRLWNSTTGKEVDSLVAHKGAVSDLDYSADGRRLVSGGFEDRKVVVWDVKAGNVIRPVLEGHKQEVRMTRMVPGGRVLSYSTTNGLFLWEPGVAKATVVRADAWTPNMRGPGVFYSSWLDLTGDGKSLAVADGNDVTVEDLSGFLAKPR